MDDYLYVEYNLTDCDGLDKESAIESYFKDCGDEYLDCGQGYYENQTVLFTRIGDDFYHITINADIGYDKVERGDKVYFVDEITNVTWEKIPKPLPKEKSRYTFDVELSNDDYNTLTKYFLSHNINYKVLI